MPFFATIPITMISPMNDEMLNVFRVTSKREKYSGRRKQRGSQIAVGAAKVRNSNSSTVNTSTTASTSTTSRSRNDFCCSSICPP